MQSTGERFIPEAKNMKGDIEVEHFHRYHAIKDIVKNKVVLDAASGTGYGSYIISQFASSVQGIDISKEAINYANENYKKQNIQFSNESIEKLTFPDNYFDVVVSFETIEHVSEDIQYKFLKEIKRVLKNDGILIMSTPNKKTYSDDKKFNNEYHIKEFYEDEFRDFIKSEFDNTKIYCQYFSKTSILMSYDYKYLKSMNFDKNVRGLYFIIIASQNKIMLENEIDSVYYCPKYEYVEDDYTQIFYSENNQFNEKDSFKINLKRINQNIKQYIPMNGILAKSIRIDPLTTNCVLRVNSIVIEFDDLSKMNVSNKLLTNSDFTDNNKFVFFTEDPQIYIYLDAKQKIKSIEIEYDLLDFNIDKLWYSNNEKIKELENNIQIKNLEIKTSENSLEIKDTEIEVLQNNIQIKDIEIKELKNSIEVKDIELKSLYDNIKNKKIEIDILKNSLYNLENYIKEIESSRGWIILQKIKKVIGR